MAAMQAELAAMQTSEAGHAAVEARIVDVFMHSQPSSRCLRMVLLVGRVQRSAQRALKCAWQDCAP